VLAVIGSAIVYAGFFLAAAGVVLVLKPIRWLWVTKRSRGLLVGGAGVLVAGVGMILPASESRVTRVKTHLDEFAPVCQFRELHSIKVAAPPSRVFEAIIGTVVMAPPGTQGTLTPEVFQADLAPGFALATMNFLVAADGRGRSFVSTETRVFANSPASRRRFAAYWRLIYPGSAVIRRMWLRAIERRATSPNTS
jgi:hypothetical protein